MGESGIPNGIPNDIPTRHQTETKVSEDKDISPSSKKRYGEFQNILLNDKEIKKLHDEIGEDMTNQCITYLDEYCEMKDYRVKSHYLAIKKWVIDAVKKEKSHKKEDWLDRMERLNQETDEDPEESARLQKELKEMMDRIGR